MPGGANMNHSAPSTRAVPWRSGALIVTATFVVKLVVLLQLWNHTQMLRTLPVRFVPMTGKPKGERR